MMFIFIQSVFPGAATVVPCLTTLISRNGKPHQKGVIVGIFRSLGALARALGPIILCTRMYPIKF